MSVTTPNVVEVTDANFEQLVIEGSKTRPVIVDLWAAWCGPCRTLGPILEKVADERDGAFLLAKLDVDANQVGNALLQAVKSQGIPTVVAFRDGQPVSMFIGAYPEQEVNSFVDQLLPTEAELVAEEAVAEEASGDLDAAEQGYREALEKDPANREAGIGLGRILVERGDIEGARTTVTPFLPDPEAERILSTVRVNGWGDLQDVGTRVYTFVYTMANCMRAAARHGVKVVVCDRPNPIGGIEVEGDRLEEPYTSFVGQFPIPLRHGMTIGELARLFNEAFGLGADLHVVPMDGWRRPMYHDDTGLPWVIPSPNLPTLDSAIVYPGAVLFEGTRLSEGRGTTRPFELIGAPWIDGERLADAMNAKRLAGVHFRPVFFEPTFQKHAKQTCGGCQIHVLDRARFRPLRVAVELMAEFKRQDPARFSWREPPYEYEHDKQPIDILYGSDRLRKAIDAGGDVGALIEGWAADEAAFRKIREKYLLYS